MTELADGSVDLVVTSPPYPMIEMWDSQFAAWDGGQDGAVAGALAAGDGGAAFTGMHRLLDAVWSECRRVLRDGGFACINIGDATRTVGGNFRLYSNHTRITEAFLDLGFQVLPLILWRKAINAPNKFMGSGMLPSGAYVTLEHEYILIFRKGGKRRFDAREEKKRRRESAYFWEERNRWFVDLWDLAGKRQDVNDPLGPANNAAGEPSHVGTLSRGRSAAFPFELPYRLINMYSLRGDMVLDPFLGTGTTMIAALAAGRNSAGFEIEPSFCEEARRAVLGCRNPVNETIAKRLSRHEEVVAGETNKGRSFKNFNEHHGFGVVSAQETDLRIEFVSSVRETAKGPIRFEAEYSASRFSPQNGVAVRPSAR
jgi:DNA modification methylase